MKEAFLYVGDVQIGPIPQNPEGFKSWIRSQVNLRSVEAMEQSVRNISELTGMEVGDVFGFLAEEYPRAGFRRLASVWNRDDIPAVTLEQIMESVLPRCEPHREEWSARGCLLT